MKFNGKLHDYQKTCLKWMLDRETSPDAPGGFLSLDMGLGKTIMTIVTICINQLDHTLIIVPKNILNQWVSEFEKFTGETPLVVTATMSNKGDVTHDMIRAHPVVITPISTFGSMRDDENSTLMTFKFDRVVVDEAHLIRNKRSKSYKLVKKLDSIVKWCLTGTLINKNHSDFTSLLEFMTIYNVNLSYAARKYLFRITKEDVESIQIPDLIINDLRSDFETQEERNIYDDIVENGKVLLKAYNAYGSGEGRMQILKQLLRLRQAVTNPCLVPDDDEFFDGTSTKLNMLKTDIQSSPVEKTLIFCHWIKEIDSIRTMLEEIGHKSVILTGKIASEGRDEAICKFTDDPDMNFFIVQIEAGGIGLNIQAASRIYINSLAWNASSELQAIARAHRIGQKNNVVVKRLIINGTIDEDIIALQQKKLSIAAEVLGDTRIEDALKSKNSSAFKALLSVFK
jgi:SNF2 family DNA or RNA helicase